MSGLLYIAQPQVVDAPPGTDPNSLAWFGQFASGHLRHVDQALASWAGRQTPPVAITPTPMSWAEYLRLLDESHWYEDGTP